MAGEDQVIFRILEAARLVHATLGPGFVEGIYGRALTTELRSREFRVDRERIVKIWYGGSVVGKHRIDLLVDEVVILELKATRGLIPVHVAQMQSYLHATDYPFGLLLNFGLTDLQWELVRGVEM